MNVRDFLTLAAVVNIGYGLWYFMNPNKTLIAAWCLVAFAQVNAADNLQAFPPAR